MGLAHTIFGFGDQRKSLLIAFGLDPTQNVSWAVISQTALATLKLTVCLPVCCHGLDGRQILVFSQIS